jgi:hypothetical protein
MPNNILLLINKLIYKLFIGSNKSRLVPLISSINENYDNLIKYINNNNLKIKNHNQINNSITLLDNINDYLINLNFKVVYNNEIKNNIIIIIKNDKDCMFFYINQYYGFINVCFLIDYINNIYEVIDVYNKYIDLFINLFKLNKKELNIDKLYLLNDCYIYYNYNNYKLANILRITNLNIDYKFSKENNIIDTLEDIYNYDNSFIIKFKKYINNNDLTQYKLIELGNILLEKDNIKLLELIKFIEDYLNLNYPNNYNIIEFNL